MSPAAPKRKMSYSEYAAREATSDVKHEYLDGEVFAMAGGTIEHGVLTERVKDAIKATLPAGCGCVVVGPDIRVRTPSGKGTYPDGFVVCGKFERAKDDDNSVTNPTVIVEVLSKDAESYDRGEKFDHYRGLASIKEYVLVAYRKPQIESHLRNADGSWTVTYAVAGDSLVLRSIDARLDVSALYEGLSFESGAMRLA